MSSSAPSVFSLRSILGTLFPLADEAITARPAVEDHMGLTTLHPPNHPRKIIFGRIVINFGRAPFLDTSIFLLTAAKFSSLYMINHYGPSEVFLTTKFLVIVAG